MTPLASRPSGRGASFHDSSGSPGGARARSSPAVRGGTGREAPSEPRALLNSPGPVGSPGPVVKKRPGAPG